MKRVRLLHAGALRLDSCFSALGLSAAAGEQLRRAQQKVLEKLAQQAREWPADLIILSGRLFDTIPVRADTLSRTLEALEQMAPTQICILPEGEEAVHDLSPWAFARIPDNVTVFTEPDWMAAEHPHLPVTVHGKRGDSEEDLSRFFEELSLPDDGRIHLAVILYSEETPASLPSPPAGLAWLASGMKRPDTDLSHKDDGMSSVVSDPQALSFKDCGEKYMYKVEIIQEADGRFRHSMDTISSSSLIFEKRTIDAADLMALEESNGEILALSTANLKRVLLHLQIQGRKSWRDIAHLAAFTKHFRSKVQFLHVEDLSELDSASLELTGADTLTREVAGQLLDRIRDCSALEEKKRLEMSLHLLVKAVYESSSPLKEEEFGER